MKRFFGFALMLVVFAAPAFGSKKPATVNIPAVVQVGTTQLPAGDYKLTLTGSGSTVQATLTQNGKAVVTFSAKTVDGKNTPGVETSTQGGVQTLQIIRLSNLSLVLDGTTQSGQ
jgi:hypothetical protein